MRALHDLYAFGFFAAYLGFGVAMMEIFTRAYIWITPYDDHANIRDGGMEAAITLAGAKLGFCFPLLAASYSGSGLLDYMAWSAIAAVLQLLWFKVSFWWLRQHATPGSPYNAAQATVLAGSSVCVGLIQAFSMIP